MYHVGNIRIWIAGSFHTYTWVAETITGTCQPLACSSTPFGDEWTDAHRTTSTQIVPVRVPLVEPCHDLLALLAQNVRNGITRDLALEVARDVVGLLAEEPGELQHAEVVVPAQVRPVRVARGLDRDREGDDPHDEGCAEGDPGLAVV